MLALVCAAAASATSVEINVGQRPIIAANPLSPEIATAIAEPESKGINWQKAAIGALIGGAVGLVSLLVRRRKKKGS